ncbi:MAG: hypothetical protein ACE5GM_11370 [bacterium]
MDAATVASLITLLTPGVTGLIKKFIPDSFEKEFKRFLPVVPPLVGALLGFASQKFGLQITSEVNNAVVGVFLGALGSSGYDAIKANRKVKGQPDA